MHKKTTVTAMVVLAALFISLSGCARKNVRHLASDASLVVPEQTTREQVLSYLGQPDEHYATADGGETWVYYALRKDFLAKTPYIGDRIGEQQYETVRVTFNGDVVRTCEFRFLTKKEAQQNGSTE